MFYYFNINYIFLFVFTKTKAPSLEIPNVAICSINGEKSDRVEVFLMHKTNIDIIENEGANRLIQDTFVVVDEDTHVDEIYDDIHDVALIDKAQKPL